MNRHSRLRSLSPKKAASLTGPVYSTITSPRKPIKKRNAKRQASEFQRTYFSLARKRFINRLPCAWCRIIGYSENAHVTDDGTKGGSRKSGYECIAPLCGPLGNNCHRKFDTREAPFDREDDRAFIEAQAPVTHAAWLAYSGEAAA